MINLEQLQTELKDHWNNKPKVFNKAIWEIYKKKERSLKSKIIRRKQKAGILMSREEFQKYYESVKDSHFGYIPHNKYDETIIMRLTPSQKNRMYYLACRNHMR